MKINANATDVKRHDPDDFVIAIITGSSI